MKKAIKRVLKILGYSFLTIILVFAGFLGFMTMKDFRPQSSENIDIGSGGTPNDGRFDTISLLTWNIGYAGLGMEQDFFFEEGKNVRPSKDENEKYMKGILNQLENETNIDFILLQEVDKKSKRSYFQDQVVKITQNNTSFCSGFATNYKSSFVPQPVAKPYGKCYSGILTLAKKIPEEAMRYSLSADAGWPMGLFMLKRCFMVFRYKLNNQKELVVINLHLSAYDDGSIKQQQMDTLAEFVKSEYQKGNYVIAGGDWNQYPPGYKSTVKRKDIIVEKTAQEDYPEPGWTWAVDYTTNTNRLLYESYQNGQTDEGLIDYFLLSPNVSLVDINGVDMGFKYSDHNPVKIKVVLNN